MTKENASSKGSQSLLSMLNSVSAATRATHIRLFHGLVPALIALEDIADLATQAESKNLFLKRTEGEGLRTLYAITSNARAAAEILQGRASELGYPLEDAAQQYRAAEKRLLSGASFETALQDSIGLDWDAWLSALTDTDNPNA